MGSTPTDRPAGCSASAARSLFRSRLRRKRRADIVWPPRDRQLPANGGLCRSHPEGRQTCRTPGAGPYQVCAGDQSQDRQNARPHRPRYATRTRRRGDRMIGRRQLITLLGGAAAWPFASRAQPGRMRRIGVLSTGDDVEGHARFAAFAQALEQLGWSDGRNLRIDTRYATADNVHRHAMELAALAPDVLVAATGTATAAPCYRRLGLYRLCL